MWPFVNFRQVSSKKRDKKPQRLNYKIDFNFGDYWTSKCELEIRYYLSRTLQKEFASSLARESTKKRKAFIYRNKRQKIAKFYIEKFNPELTRKMITDSRINMKNFGSYQKITSFIKPCMLCNGCYLKEHSLCRKAQGSMQYKYGFFRTRITY